MFKNIYFKANDSVTFQTVEALPYTFNKMELRYRYGAQSEFNFLSFITVSA